jgi:hypothetical protein
MSREIMQQCLDLITKLDKDGMVLEAELIFALRDELTKPEQSPKLTNAGEDTNMSRGLEPKGSGMVILNQPEQEPVAWCSLNGRGEIGYFDGKPMIMVGKVGNDCHETPLYTAPPRKEWVGLSVNEARDFFESKLTRAELITEISEFLEKKNNAV